MALFEPHKIYLCILTRFIEIVGMSAREKREYHKRFPFSEEKIILYWANNKINKNAYILRENYKRVLSCKIPRGFKLVHKAKGNKSPNKRTNFL